MSTIRMVTVKIIRNDLKGSGSRLISGTVQDICIEVLRKITKISVRLFMFRLRFEPGYSRTEVRNVTA
jgi:hypothetical protein